LFWQRFVGRSESETDRRQGVGHARELLTGQCNPVTLNENIATFWADQIGDQCGAFLSAQLGARHRLTLRPSHQQHRDVITQLKRTGTTKIINVAGFGIWLPNSACPAERGTRTLLRAARLANTPSALQF
jgi:hypothetical protein